MFRICSYSLILCSRIGRVHGSILNIIKGLFLNLLIKFVTLNKNLENNPFTKPKLRKLFDFRVD